MKQLLEATEKWVGICMKDYGDSRTVPDELVGLCVEISRVRALIDKEIKEMRGKFTHYDGKGNILKV